jgi:prevent-host-death family protein
VIGSKEARIKWRDLLDGAIAGTDAVIERSGQRVAALIPYSDYEALLEDLEDLRAERQAVEAYEEWQRDPSTARPFEEFEAELIAEGLLDE